MNFFKTYFLLIPVMVLTLFTNVAVGQDDNKKQYLDSLVSLVDQQILEEKYQEAHTTLVSIFNLNTVLPDEVAFYYGKTLFHLQKYSSCQSALKKYIHLTGKKGFFYKEAMELDYYAQCQETGMANVEEACHVCDGSGNSKSSCRSCKGSGKMICSSCRGTGVFQTTNSFGTKYDTCLKCSGKGLSACSTCNGKKEIKGQCPYCSATGTIKLKVPCK